MHESRMAFFKGYVTEPHYALQEIYSQYQYMDVNMRNRSLSLLLIDNYDSFTYNLYQAFLVLGASVTVIRNDHPDLKKDLSRFSGIVISPGPGRPDDTGLSRSVIRTYSGKVPILGVCLGMQCINEVFGGNTVKAPVPVHGKTSLIRHSGSPLYSGVPSPFTAARYHSLIIEPAESLCLTAFTDNDIPMSVQEEGQPIWGIQYHPESFLTPHGPKILGNFLGFCQG